MGYSVTPEDLPALEQIAEDDPDVAQSIVPLLVHEIGVLRTEAHRTYVHAHGVGYELGKQHGVQVQQQEMLHEARAALQRITPRKIRLVHYDYGTAEEEINAELARGFGLLSVECGHRVVSVVYADNRA